MCIDDRFHALTQQDGLPATSQLVHVLETGMRVLLFSVQFDVICNRLGTEKFLAKLEWSGKEVSAIINY